MAPITRSSPRSSSRNNNNNNNKLRSSSGDTPSEPVNQEQPSQTSSKFRRRKRGCRIREQSDEEEAVIPLRGSTRTIREPSFTKVISSKTAHHSAYCCRLGLPRRFCVEHKVPKHVTMTDSTGGKRWHMRFQVRHASGCYTISNGWREFSYDHSLKTGDKLEFTLVSSVEFRVGFAASDGRAMVPTHDGDQYPWKINYSRLACLSWEPRDLRHSKDREDSEDNVSQDETLGRPQPPGGRPITRGMEKATAFVQNIVSVLFPEKLNPGQDDELQGLTQAQSSEDQLPEEGAHKHSQSNDPNGTIANKPIISLPKKLPPPEEEEQIYCQCKKLLNEQQQRSFKVPRTNHLECKKPDGTTYVQICDSDSEVAD